MPNYGRPLQFGYFLIPDAAMHSQLIQTAQTIEALGFEFVGIQDHPYQWRFLDTWTLMSMIAAKTERLRIFPDVLNLPLRPPALVAKSAASLDLLSGGRFELGIGAGAFWEPIAAMGGPMRSPKEAFDALEEAITLIRRLWSGERAVTFPGQFYSVKGTHPGPMPAHRINIWVGAVGPKMMNLIGRIGDGWIPSLAYVPPDKILELQQRIDDGAHEAGRDPAAIRRLLNIGGSITSGDSDGLLRGPIDQWVDELAALALEYGVDTFILAENDLNQVRRFAEEIIPRVRERATR
jgi:alkanesulfonate monooxygenase SsuD/methylene tetrahydromethanopterin reductase-like flavin-dependent oxidoreductase (luciferase family)